MCRLLTGSAESTPTNRAIVLNIVVDTPPNFSLRRLYSYR